MKHKRTHDAAAKPAAASAAKPVSTGSTAASVPVSSGLLSTKGAQIVDAQGRTVHIRGVNLYGLEGTDFTLNGLWAASLGNITHAIKAAGFNTIRVPWSIQLLDSGSKPKQGSIDYSLNPAFKGLSGLELLDAVIASATNSGLWVILDCHRASAGNSGNADGLWYDQNYTQSDFENAWETMANRYGSAPCVIGADLCNEPKSADASGKAAATWSAWSAEAKKVGDLIHQYAPGWLIIVEGIQEYATGDLTAQGTLEHAAAAPIKLTQPDKLVYSTHEYPHEVFPCAYDQASNYPANMSEIWDNNWGFLLKQDTAPVFIGEFGTALQAPNSQAWLTTLTDYMNQYGAHGCVWAWAPPSFDQQGITDETWCALSSTGKQIAGALK